jgi:hypothetical protein
MVAPLRFVEENGTTCLAAAGTAASSEAQVAVPATAKHKWFAVPATAAKRGVEKSPI